MDLFSVSEEEVCKSLKQHPLYTTWAELVVQSTKDHPNMELFPTVIASLRWFSESSKEMNYIDRILLSSISCAYMAYYKNARMFPESVLNSTFDSFLADATAKLKGLQLGINSSFQPDSGRKKRSNFPKRVQKMLRRWMQEHEDCPYPTEDEKVSLANECDITKKQLEDWFVNARRRRMQ